MSIETMGTGLKTRLETITALKNRVYAPNGLPATINVLPCALIIQGPVTYDQTFDGAITVDFRVIVLVGKEDQKERLNDILDYTETSGDDSVKYAIEGDHTLGDTCDFCIVTDCTGPGYTEWGGTQYISADFNLHAEKY